MSRPVTDGPGFSRAASGRRARGGGLGPAPALPLPSPRPRPCRTLSIACWSSLYSTWAVDKLSTNLSTASLSLLYM